MTDSQTNRLVVCSVLLAPIRRLIPVKLIVWIDRIVRLPVHTFVVEESKLPLNQKRIDGYWYCAGDFCDIDEAGVYQELIKADIPYAKCLVAPNIKDKDPLRPTKVIAGEFGVHYVCHNITNRILFATKNRSTLFDLEISKSGYEVVVKTTLGVYGQNKVEWERKIQKCSSDKTEINQDLKTKPDNDESEIYRKAEILKIHKRACHGDIKKAVRLTDSLRDIDSKFFITTLELIKSYENQLIDFVTFNHKMLGACSTLFTETIYEVGIEMTKYIYPNCILEIKNDDDLEPPEEYVVAGG